MRPKQKKSVLVTGGASGIGEYITCGLIDDNFDVHVSYLRSSKKFKALQSHYEKQNIVLTGTKANIQNPEECETLIDDCLRQGHHLWGLVLNAGVFMTGDPLTMPVSDWHSLIETNMSSAVYILKHALPHIRKNKGSIVFIGTGSIADSSPTKSYPLYTASKAGLYVLMRSLAVTEGEYGVRVNMVSPGIIDAGNYTDETITKFKDEIPLRRIGLPDDIANVARFLLSEKASYVSGANIDVCGGWFRGQ